jgi:uncharacterized protein (TIGR02284 family)
VKDTQLKKVLTDYSRQRNEFAYELEQQIRIQGGDPQAGGDLAASAHRIWINIRGMFSGEDARAIIEECLRGEKESIDFFERILNETTFSNDTRMLLTHQLKEIKAAREKLEEIL